MDLDALLNALEDFPINMVGESVDVFILLCETEC